MPKVYIAGPMRGYPQLNFPAFDWAAKQAISRGWDVISPADLDRESGVHENEAQASGDNPALLRAFVRRDVDALLSLRAEEGDAIAMLPGWPKSVGAFAENAVSKWLKLRILDALTFNQLG